MRCSSFSSVIALLIFHRTIIALLLKQRSDQMQIMPCFAAETSTQITVKESRMIEQWRVIYRVGKHSVQQYYTHGPSRERQRVYFPHSNNTLTSTLAIGMTKYRKGPQKTHKGPKRSITG